MSRPLNSLHTLRSSLPCLPGPSSRPSPSSLPSSSSSSSARSFHVSPPAFVRPKKRNKPSHTALSTGVPNPILGFVDRSTAGLTERQLVIRRNREFGRSRPTGPTPWDTCRLARTIVHPQQIYDLPQPDYAAGEKPRFLLPGISEDDKTWLFGAIPHITASLAYNPDAHYSAREGELAAIVEAQDRQSEMLSRILDLRNANRRGIMAENRRRIVQEFGGGWDTGKSEVQAAVLTLQIRMLHEHVTLNHKDNANKRALRLLVQKRQKVLKYLKRRRPADYDACLADLGLEREAVEGEQLIGM